MQRIVINTCYGGYGLSDLAIEELIKLGALVPCRYIKEVRDPETGLFVDKHEYPENVVFDNELVPESDCNPADLLDFAARYHKAKAEGKSGYFSRRYWGGHAFRYDRSNQHLIDVVKRLGDKANGEHVQLKIVEIPEGVEWEIEEYDGTEWIAEKHRTWS